MVLIAGRVAVEAGFGQRDVKFKWVCAALAWHSWVEANQQTSATQPQICFPATGCWAVCGTRFLFDTFCATRQRHGGIPLNPSCNASTPKPNTQHPDPRISSHHLKPGQHQRVVTAQLFPPPRSGFNRSQSAGPALRGSSTQSWPSTDTVLQGRSVNCRASAQPCGRWGAREGA